MSLCIVVPYRNRKEHLEEFTPWLEDYLTEKNIKYRLLVVEQYPNKLFNRGKLLNVGFHHTRRDGHTYYCFHDVDMFPVEADYSPVSTPTHLSARVRQYGWKMPYPEIIGGVLLCPTEIFQRVNGYGNHYWGWGTEDDDLYHRFQKLDIPIDRRPGIFDSHNHHRMINQHVFDLGCERLQHFRASMRPIEDFGGLNTLKYRVRVASPNRIMVAI